jgi:hypothetical protein
MILVVRMLSIVQFVIWKHTIYGLQFVTVVTNRSPLYSIVPYDTLSFLLIMAQLL